MNCDKCGAPCYISADGDLLFDKAEIEQDSSKINKTGIGHARNNMAGACGIYDGETPKPGLPLCNGCEAADRIIFNTWTCRFCGSTYAGHDLAIEHALDCDDNEDTHSCNTCRHNRVILGDQECVVTCVLLKTRDIFTKYCDSWQQKKGL